MILGGRLRRHAETKERHILRVNAAVSEEGIHAESEECEKSRVARRRWYTRIEEENVYLRVCGLWREVRRHAE